MKNTLNLHKTSQTTKDSKNSEYDGISRPDPPSLLRHTQYLKQSFAFIKFPSILCTQGKTMNKILSNSMSVAGTWSKLVKYVILTFILWCYYVAARFSLRQTRSHQALTTRPPRAHQVQQVLTTFSQRQRRWHQALTTTFQSLPECCSTSFNLENMTI